MSTATNTMRSATRTAACSRYRNAGSRGVSYSDHRSYEGHTHLRDGCECFRQSWLDGFVEWCRNAPARYPGEFGPVLLARLAIAVEMLSGPSDDPRYMEWDDDPDVLLADCDRITEAEDDQAGDCTACMGSAVGPRGACEACRGSGHERCD